MPRIFACLALAVSMLLLATGGLGLFAFQLSVDRHVLLAVMTLLLSAFVQVVAFTYLTVTGKMIGQAVHLAGLDAAALGEVKRLKRGVTRCLPLVVLPILLLTATGAALWRSGGDSAVHLMAACLVLAAHAGVFWVEYRLIARNASLLDRVLADYAHWRGPRKPLRKRVPADR